MKIKTTLLSLITVFGISITHANNYFKPIKVTDSYTYTYILLALLDSEKASYYPGEDDNPKMDKVRRCWQINALKTRQDFITLNKEFASQSDLDFTSSNKVISNNLKLIGDTCKE